MKNILFALLTIPSMCYADDFDQLLEMLRNRRINSAPSPFVDVNPAPFPFIDPQSRIVVPNVIQIQPHPMMLKEQIITERLGDTPNNPVSRAIAGALVVAELRQRRR